MRLYKIVGKNKPSGNLPDTTTKWVGTKAEAVAARKELTDTGYKRADIDSDEIDVPTDKAGLLDWLNKNVR